MKGATFFKKIMKAKHSEILATDHCSLACTFAIIGVFFKKKKVLKKPCSVISGKMAYRKIQFLCTPLLRSDAVKHLAKWPQKTDH